MSTTITKKQIELYAKVGYFELSRTFKLPIKELFKLLEINNYRIEDNCIEIFDNNGDIIHYETYDGSWSKWCKWEYDGNGNIIYIEDSNGQCYKREFDKDSKLIKKVNFHKVDFHKYENNNNNKYDKSKNVDKSKDMLHNLYNLSNLLNISLEKLLSSLDVTKYN